MSTKNNLKNETSNGKKPVVLCKKVKLIFDMNGNLKYYRCRNCKETFVSQNGGELEISAR
jgi:transposase-like protein